jgi:hypothetical protein
MAESSTVDPYTAVPSAAVPPVRFQAIELALLFACSVAGTVSRGAKLLPRSLYYLGWVAIIGLGGWVVGGLAAMGLASFSPEFYRNSIIGAPQEQAALLRYAWVGGSIWGIELGGVIGTVLACVVYRNTARRPSRRSAGLPIPAE